MLNDSHPVLSKTARQDIPCPTTIVVVGASIAVSEVIGDLSGEHSTCLRWTTSVSPQATPVISPPDHGIGTAWGIWRLGPFVRTTQFRGASTRILGNATDGLSTRLLGRQIPFCLAERDFLQFYTFPDDVCNPLIGGG